MKRTFFIFLVMIIVLLSLTGCSKEINVVIKDMGQAQVIIARTNMDVLHVLKNANINIDDKDKTEPPLDSLITEDSIEIIIKRYAKVTVIKGEKRKELELVGATVKEAIEKSGFTLEDNEEPNYQINEYLIDGMVIKIMREISISLQVDNQGKFIKTKATTVGELLEEQKIVLGSNDEININLDERLEDNAKIIIKRVEYKEESITESINYETEEKYSDSMYEGDSETTQEGKKGKKEVTYKVKYVDGKEDSKEKLSEKTIKKPVNKIITYGTKTNLSSYLGWWRNNNSSGAGIGVNFLSINGNTASFIVSRTAVGAAHFGETNTIVATIKNGKTIDFTFDQDGWNNSGYGTITLNGNSIHLKIDIDDYNSAQWGIYGEADLTR